MVCDLGGYRVESHQRLVEELERRVGIVLCPRHDTGRRRKLGRVILVPPLLVAQLLLRRELHDGRVELEAVDQGQHARAHQSRLPDLFPWNVVDWLDVLVVEILVRVAHKADEVGRPCAVERNQDQLHDNLFRVCWCNGLHLGCLAYCPVALGVRPWRWRRSRGLGDS